MGVDGRRDAAIIVRRCRGGPRRDWAAGPVREALNLHACLSTGTVMIALLISAMVVAYLYLRSSAREIGGVAGSGPAAARWFACVAAGTVASCVLAMAVCTFVDPVLAVWSGGTVVLAGAGCIVVRHESDRRRFSRELDRELAALLEAA